MYILVTGSSGFIGSRIVKKLLDQDYSVICIDLLDYYDLPDNYANKFYFYRGDLCDRDLMDYIFDTHEIGYVFHLAASIKVPEGEKFPLMYYQNNIESIFVILEMMQKYNCKNIVFASTSAVYGTASDHSFTEEQAGDPISVYGRSKLFGETIIKDVCDSENFNYVIFRFFNAAGGVDHSDQQNHLIPVVIDKIKKQEPPIEIFGTDYSTPDGTCVRDYIHVDDIADAFLYCVPLFDTRQTKEIINLGSAKGYSVREIINECFSVLNTIVLTKDRPRRAGDPAFILADSSKAKRVLNWEPQKTLKDMILDTYSDDIP